MKKMGSLLLAALLLLLLGAPLYAKTGFYEEYQDPADVIRKEQVFSMEHLDLTVREAEQAADDACAEAEKAGADRALVKLWGIGRARRETFDAMLRIARLPLTVQADTRDPDNAVDVRITLDPTQVQHNLHLYGATSTWSAGAAQVKNLLERRYDTTLSVIELGQEGSYGIWVQIAAKADLTGLKTDSLRFYTYRQDMLAPQELASQEYRLDDNGYLHFSTWQGDYIVISDRALI